VAKGLHVAIATSQPWETLGKSGNSIRPKVKAREGRASGSERVHYRNFREFLRSHPVNLVHPVKNRSEISGIIVTFVQSLRCKAEPTCRDARRSPANSAIRNPHSTNSISSFHRPTTTTTTPDC